MKLFQKPETAATYALDNRKDPNKLRVLVEGGRTESADGVVLDAFLCDVDLIFSAALQGWWDGR